MKTPLKLILMLLLGSFAVLDAAEERPRPAYEQLVQTRINEAIAATSQLSEEFWKSRPGQAIHMAILLLAENRKLDVAEQIIADHCGNPLTTYVGKPVPQSRNEAVFRIYLMEKTRERLSPKAREAIEDFAWMLLTKYNRNITRADADKSFWLFSSSENHYLNDRRRYTQALQIVRMSPRYGPNHKLGEETIEAHYQAWTQFWIRYFEARAGEGTDMEIAHPSSYGICTVGVYYDLHDLTDSPRLRELAGKFLTLYWAEVAAEFEPRTGQRALAGTRNPDFTGNLTGWARNLLYAYGWNDLGWQGDSLGLLPFLLSSYRPPEILRAIAHDPKRGSYQTTSRRALMIESEEREKSGVIVFDKNGDGHFRRDVFYTPDYTLSTMTLDPSRKYNNTGDLAQVMGVTFAADVNARIVVTSTGYYAKRAISGITGTAVSIIARDPNAKPGRGRFMSEGTRVFIRKGPLWDNRVEDASGWFFTRAGDAFAAIRMPEGYTATTRTYIWPGRKLEEAEEKNGHFLELKDMWAPIVIQMGRAADYKSFEAFQASVKARKFEYENGKLTYESEAKDGYEYWANSKQLPKINDTTVNLNPAKTYDSPYLSMKHGESKAVIKCPGYDDVVLEF
jgi:hypothetical protein|uniref:hypothetical protein n=1 Tax=Prosthecobacter sp. TaxID=1965333 RepID=UPI0037847683